MAKVKFKLNKRWAREFLKSQDVVDCALTKAEASKKHAESIAPRSDKDHQHYADNFYVEVSDRSDRRGARVVNNTPYAAVIETRDAVLGRSIDAARADG